MFFPTHYFLRCLSLISLCMVLPVQAVTTLDRDTVLGVDDASHRSLFLQNIQSLERHIMGDLPAHTQQLHQKLGLADDPVEIVDYASALSRAEQLGFSWAQATHWHNQSWEIFSASQHQGQHTAWLAPLSNLDHNRALHDDSPLAPRPNSWSVCRVATTHGFVYGYYDGVDPVCSVGDPRTLQWDSLHHTWQHSLRVKDEQVLIPHQHSQFSVLPLDAASAVAPHRLAATLVKVSQKAQGFATDFAVDNSNTAWPEHTVGHRLARLVNTLGIIDFTVHKPFALALSPDQCSLGLSVPAASPDDAPIYLWYRQVLHRHSVPNRYRCTVTAVDLERWLKDQLTYDVAISDVAFVSVDLTYSVDNTAAAISPTQLNVLRASVDALIQQTSDVQSAINDRYIETLLYAKSWFSLFFPSYVKQHDALATLYNQDLRSFSIAQLSTQLSGGFPTAPE